MLLKIKAFLSSVLSKAKVSLVSLVAKMQLPIGIAIGYLGHGVIKFAIDVVVELIKVIKSL